MSESRPTKPGFKKPNSIITARLAFPNPSYLLDVTCDSCGNSFYFDDLKAPPKVDEGVISDAHGEVRGFQFKFPCPRCSEPLRFDEDEVKLTVRAVPEAEHS